MSGRNASPARRESYGVLRRIESGRGFSSDLLAAAAGRLSPPDLGLCYEIVLGVLRRRFLLDRVIAGCTGGRRIDPEIRTILRLSLYQLRFLDRVPPYAVVNDAVTLARSARKTSAAGLVNAVLRRALREPFVPEFSDETDRLSVLTSHPRSLIERWTNAFGAENAAALAEFNNRPPEAEYRWTLKTAESTRARIASAGSDELPGLLRELAEAGEIYFQDRGSQIVAGAVAPKGRILDVCAAPGSKATLIALNGADLVVAGDADPERAAFLAANCRRQGAARVAVVRFDAERPLPFAEGEFDSVLVDAPCSGTGTIRRNPEIRYRFDPDSLASLAAKQLSILSEASKTVRSGGRLVYSTCSLEREENEDVARGFLAASPDFRLEVPQAPAGLVTDEGFARTFPPRDGCDGFFIASFVRT